MPAYKKENGTWYCSFYFTDYTGRKIKKKKSGFETRRAALAWERDFLEHQSTAPTMTTAALADLYIADSKSTKRPSTASAISYLIRKNILPYFKNTPINEITPAMIRKWLITLTEKVSPATAHTSRTQMSAMMNYAVKYYHLPNNPVKIAGAISKYKPHRMDFWTVDQFNQFIATQPRGPYRASFLLLFFGGLRIGELQALTLADIDFDNSTVNIDKTFYPTIGTGPTKTEKSHRKIKLPAAVMQEIRSYVDSLYQPSPGDRVFPFGRDQYRRRLNDQAKKLGLPHIRLHDFRHSHASLLINLGFSPVMIRDRLGHESIQTTLQIYSHLYPSKESELTAALDKIAISPPAGN